MAAKVSSQTIAFSYDLHILSACADQTGSLDLCHVSAFACIHWSFWESSTQICIHVFKDSDSRFGLAASMLQYQMLVPGHEHLGAIEGSLILVQMCASA